MCKGAPRAISAVGERHCEPTSGWLARTKPAACWRTTASATAVARCCGHLTVEATEICTSGGAIGGAEGSGMVKHWMPLEQKKRQCKKILLS